MMRKKLKSIISYSSLSFYSLEVNNFFRLLKKNFNINFLLNGSRNPYKIKEISKFNDDDRWLIMSEGRICEQNWLVCTPKNI